MIAFARFHRSSRLPQFLLVAPFLIATMGFAALVGCGGSSAITPSIPVTPPPPASDFSIDVGAPAQIQQGAVSGIILRVSINGAPDPVSITFPNLPPGITVTPAGPISVPDNFTNPTVLVYATSQTAVGSYTITVQGTNGSVTHTYTVPLAVTTPAPFQLQLSPSSLSLSPGGSAQVQASIVSAGSTPVSVGGVSATTDPQRQDLDLPAVTYLSTNVYNVTFSIDYASQPSSNIPVFITAQSGTDTSTVVLPVSISGGFPTVDPAANRSTVIRTDEEPQGVVYDQARKLLFLAIPGLNQVRVLSSVDLHTVAIIPVPQFQDANPVSGTIDESIDGSEIFVGGPGQIATINPSTLQVTATTAVPQAASSAPGAVPALGNTQLAALSNGHVLVLNQNSGHLFLWNTSTGLMTPNDAPGMTGTASMIHSGNHNRVLVFGSPSDALYDAASASFITEQRFPGDPLESGPYPAIAMNPDGTQITAVGQQLGAQQGISVYDDSFNLLPTQPAADPTFQGFPIYSRDGSTLYVIGGRGYLSEDIAFNTQTYKPTGLFALNSWFTAGIPLAIDETGMIYGNLNDAGTGYAMIATDASHPGAIQEEGADISPSLTFPNVLTNPAGYLTQTSPASIQGASFDPAQNYQIFLGAPPASPSTLPATGVTVASSNRLNFTIPQGKVAGPANVTLTRPDGWFSIIADGLSYGPTILAATPNTVSPSGQTPITLIGYVLDGSVSIGGNSAGTGSEAGLLNNGGDLFPFQQMTAQAPSGNPGNADLALSGTHGTTTLNSAIHYLQDQQSYPIPGGVGGIAYDQAHQRLYVSNTGNNNVAVFDLAAKSLATPIPVGNGPTSVVLTPDGAELAVLNATDGTVSVIDPAQEKVVATYPVLTQIELLDQISVFSMTAVAPHRLLMAVRQNDARLLNLDTGSMSCAGVAGCDTAGTGINTGFQTTLVRSNSDGAKAYMMDGNSQIDALSFPDNTLTTKVGTSRGQVGAAISQDGSVIAAGLAAYDGQLNFLNAMGNDIRYLGTSLDAVFGQAECLNPSGSLLLVAEGPYSPVDVYDVHTSRVVMQIAVPNAGTAQVMDETGTKLFSLGNGGLSISQLAAAPLSIASVTPKTGPAGTTVTVRGSGFQNGAVVKFGTMEASASFTDSMTLSAIVPSLSSGPAQITIINPDGTQYSYDAAFSVN